MVIDTDKLKRKIRKEIEKEKQSPTGDMGMWLKDAWRLERIEDMYKHCFGEENNKCQHSQ